MSPPTAKQLARAQLLEIDSACAAALSNLHTAFIATTELMGAKLAADIHTAMADYEAKDRTLKAELETLKAAHMSEADVRCKAYAKEFVDVFGGYAERKLALAREEGFWGLGCEDAMEVLGLGEGVARGAETIAALGSMDAASSSGAEAGGQGKSRSGVGSGGAAESPETEVGAEEKSGAAVGSKKAASSPETEIEGEEKSGAGVSSKKAASSPETEIEVEEKSGTGVGSNVATSSPRTRMSGTKGRPTYEQKVMVLDPDQMAVLEAKMANVMRRRR